MMCLHPHNGIPCGHCMACRLNRQNEKKLRICHEAEYYDKSCFVTLTYDPKRYNDRNLIKKDLQDFIKRVRRYIEPDRIKYFACGEYGDISEHAHYHIIFFGLSLFDNRVFGEHKWNASKSCWYATCKAWDKGFVTLGAFNEARAAYVAKYCVKKWSGKGADEYYHGRQPEFCLTSQGLGLQWLENHKKLLLNDGFVRVKKKRVPLPRYYEEKLFPKDTYRNIEWRAYKEAKGQESFDRQKESSGTHDKESFEKWQDEVRKQTALFMATKLQRKKGVNNV